MGQPWLLLGLIAHDGAHKPYVWAIGMAQGLHYISAQHIVRSAVTWHRHSHSFIVYACA